MPRFKPNVPVTTEKPLVEVDTRGMGAGEYKFQLVVVDDRGEESAPAVVIIRVGNPDRLRPSDVIVSRPSGEAADTKPNTRDKPPVTKPKAPKKPKSGRKAKGDQP